MKKLIPNLFAVIIVACLGITLLLPRIASADSFNQNKIIDDRLFENANTMSPSQIDTFLNTFPDSCISPNSGFQAVDPVGYSPNTGYSFSGFVTAGRVIADAAQAYTINPQVLLVTLEKEQSLVSGRNNFAGYCNNGDQHKYAAAVGYGCPDSSTTYSYSGLNLYQRNGVTVSDTGTTCVNTAVKAGFSQQVIRAAWLLKFGEQRSEGNLGWAVVKGGWDNSDDPQTCYGGPMTQGNYVRCPSGGATSYDGYTTIDGAAVHMDNGSTAALYWYTPHFHGNQVFYSVFTGWFGTTTYSFGARPASSTNYATAPCSIATYDASLVGRLYQPDSGDFLYTTSSSEACAAVKIGYIWDGLVMKSATGPNAVPVYRVANFSRHVFTINTSVRDYYLSNGGYRSEGVAFYAYASTQPSSLEVYSLNNGSTNFLSNVGAEGSYYVNNLGYTSSGVAFYTPSMDNTQTPIYRLVKGSERFLTASTAEKDAVLQGGYTLEGVVSKDDSAPGAHNLPVYRLVGKAGHFYTTNRSERDAAVINYGYSSEGIGWYTPDATSSGTAPIYRQTNYYNGGYRLYTGSLVEHNNARTYYGYTDEGTAWYGY